ncbi:MAG: PIG-L family deacetylase [Oscillospiraceae bacterium]|nr:PIG-L family deacetylase [Oscillospiraceae bacterium]
MIQYRQNHEKGRGDTMSMLRAVLKIAAPLPDLEKMERMLFIGPHPDDIEIGAGASAARWAAEGKQVCFLICTDGRFGTDNMKDPLPPEELAAVREREARESAAVLGVRDVRFLRFSDGAFYPEEDLLRALAGVIGDFRPDVIFAPDPDTGWECHPDHLWVGKAAKQLAVFGNNPGIMSTYGARPAEICALALYMTGRANTFVGTAGYLGRQLQAIFGCHRSQFPGGCQAAKSIRLYLQLRAADFGLRSLHRTAEGFRVLGQTQMHCFPEAGK